jgi:ABC-type dipeptide/oligopeptide/nickel transport system permease subunit
VTATDITDIGDPGRREEAAEQTETAGLTPRQLAWRRLKKDKLAMISGVVVILLILIAIFAPVLTALIGHGPKAQFPETGLDQFGTPVGPGSHFLLGTDDLGRDVLSRIIYGSRISLGIGIGATAISLVIGLAVGVVAGFYGGPIDTILSRFMDLVLSFPFLLLAIALVAKFGASFHLTLYILAFFGWPAIGRIVRGQVLALKEREFVEAARSLGAGDLRIMIVEITPNLLPIALVYSTLLIPVNIVSEATLSFLGLGINPPTASWGNMIAESQNGNLYTVAWWLLVFPSIALFLVTLAFNLLGDGVRDALDPRAGRSQLGK